MVRSVLDLNETKQNKVEKKEKSNSFNINCVSFEIKHVFFLAIAKKVNTKEET